MVWVRTWPVPSMEQWIGWPSWPVWRFGQRCPELIGFRDVEEMQWKEAA